MEMAHTALVVQANWSRLRPLILKAVPFMMGTHDEADLIAGVLSGQFRFWPGPNSFMLAALEKFPRRTRCNIFLAGGDADECLRLRERVIAWAKGEGATQTLITVRPALDRLNQHGAGPNVDGWQRRSIVYVKEL